MQARTVIKNLIYPNRYCAPDNFNLVTKLLVTSTYGMRSILFVHLCSRRRVVPVPSAPLRGHLTCKQVHHKFCVRSLKLSPLFLLVLQSKKPRKMYLSLQAWKRKLSLVLHTFEAYWKAIHLNIT